MSIGYHIFATLVGRVSAIIIIIKRTFSISFQHLLCFYFFFLFDVEIQEKVKKSVEGHGNIILFIGTSFPPPVWAIVREPGTWCSILENRLWRFGLGREIDSGMR